METVRRFRSLTIISRRRTAAFFKRNGYHGICSYRQCRLVFVIRIRYGSCPLRFIIGIGRCGKGECGILLYHTVFRQRGINVYRTVFTLIKRYLILFYLRFLFKRSGYGCICRYGQRCLMYISVVRCCSSPAGQFISFIRCCSKRKFCVLRNHTVFRQHRIGSDRTMLACFQRYLVLLYIRFGALRTTCHHYYACQ